MNLLGLEVKIKKNGTYMRGWTIMLGNMTPSETLLKHE